jgi:predicted GNAT family acetyltransferase
MRASEFITESVKLRHEPTSTGGVQVYAYIDGKEAGWVRFTKLKTGQVKAAMVHVPERLRRQGIGSAMYKYARHELGLDIVPSDSQTADGRAFWNKIHENITEAFDKPYAFNWDSSYYGNYGVYVKLPDGNSLTISFYNEDKDNDVWHVAFARGYSQEVTGEGDAQRIFATVLHAIQQFIGKEHPDKVYFSASKKVESGQNSESRSNLYSRMVNRYASSLGYDAVIDDFGRDSVMYILNKKQGVAEGTADDINKMFNNMYDPMTTNLQRVALMAMQGRQDEAGMQLNRVIKDASPEAQKKIIDAVNNIKPVTINGKVADSSTLDKSHKHQDWILNTFIPWVKKTIGHDEHN